MRRMYSENQLIKLIKDNDEGITPEQEAQLNKATEDITTLEGSKQDKLTAGENITIAEDGTISATGGSNVIKVEVDAIEGEGDQEFANKVMAVLMPQYDTLKNVEYIEVTQKNDVSQTPWVRTYTGTAIKKDADGGAPSITLQYLVVRLNRDDNIIEMQAEKATPETVTFNVITLGGGGSSTVEFTYESSGTSSPDYDAVYKALAYYIRDNFDTINDKATVTLIINHTYAELEKTATYTQTGILNKIDDQTKGGAEYQKRNYKSINIIFEEQNSYYHESTSIDYWGKNDGTRPLEVSDWREPEITTIKTPAVAPIVADDYYTYTAGNKGTLSPESRTSQVVYGHKNWSDVNTRDEVVVGSENELWGINQSSIVIGCKLKLMPLSGAGSATNSIIIGQGETGGESKPVGSNSVLIGRKLTGTASGQVILGFNNDPNTPATSKFVVAGGWGQPNLFEITENCELIMKSPNGTKYKVWVADDGTWMTDRVIEA